MRVSSRSQKVSFVFALSLHVLLVLFLIITFERTIVIPAEPPASAKEIIDAVMIDTKALQQEVARLDAVEAKKKAQEKARIQEVQRKEKEAKEKRLKEEALAKELKLKNEELKKQAELQKQEQEKIKIEHDKQEKARVAKLKAEQEELKKIQKEKEDAKAEKVKIEAEKKAAELAKLKAIKDAQERESQSQNTIRMNQDIISRYAAMMQSKIHKNWRQPIGFDYSGFTCKIAVRLMPTGEVIETNIVQSSGNIEFDRSTELAIRKASPLPMPDDPNVAKEFHQFTFTFRPEAA